MPSVVQAEQIFTIDKSRALKYLGHLTPEEMRRVDDAVRISLALNPMGSIQQIEPIRRSTAVYAPPEWWMANRLSTPIRPSGRPLRTPEASRK